MSGGSYDYASAAADLEDVIGKRYELERLGERLATLDVATFPGAQAAGQATLAMLARLQLWDAHVTATTGLLADVWHAVEWWDSNDYGPDQVRVALDRMLSPTVADHVFVGNEKHPRSGCTVLVRRGPFTEACRRAPGEHQ